MATKLQPITRWKLTRVKGSRKGTGGKSRRNASRMTKGEGRDMMCTDVSEGTKQVAIKGTYHVAAECLECPLAREMGLVGGAETGRMEGASPRGVCSREEASDGKGASGVLVRGKCSRREIIRGPRWCWGTWLGAGSAKKETVGKITQTAKRVNGEREELGTCCCEVGNSIR